MSLSSVERIVRVVEITSLPKAPDIVLGVVNVQWQIIPVINIRRRFGLSGREIDLNDHMVIARTSRRNIAFVVDNAIGVIEITEKDVAAKEDIFPDLDYVTGIAKYDKCMIHILDLETILSSHEEKSLDYALEEGTGEK